MIKENIETKDIYGNEGEFKVTQYYGNDAITFAECHKREDIKNWILSCLSKDCNIRGEKGIVIGVEDNEVFIEYYLIVFIPETKEITYELSVDLI